ncbi:acyltransferase 3, partial [marine sediment metagenome]
MKFREDINALRAIAVASVVVFHFNHSWLPGGFAGVDVFFVISGFLMTMIIVKGLEKENFS